MTTIHTVTFQGETFTRSSESAIRLVLDETGGAR